MSLNWKEIDLILKELNLNDSFLQEIKQYDYHHLLLQFYGRYGEMTLLISLQPGALRLHRTERKRKALPKPPRFTTFLKARVRGGKCTEVRQISHERIILFQIIRGGEEFNLYLKLWENSANIIITDRNGVILDCFTRRPHRNEVPGQIFQPEKDLLSPKKEFDPDRFSIREISHEEGFNRAIETFYGEKEREQELNRLRLEAERSLKMEKKRLSGRLDKLKKRLEGYEDFESYRHSGDLIMANIYRINRGDSHLELSEWDEAGVETEIVIELDPALSPAENGERYYKRYQKAVAGRDLAAEERKQVISRLSRLEDELATLSEECNRETLKTFINHEKQRKGKNNSPTPGLQFRSGPFLILVGRNAKENDELLRHHVRGNDLWLHNRDWPGGYVFIKTIKGKSVPLETLLDAGSLAIHYSRGKKAGRADLYYTEVKYLRRAKGAPKGTVLPTREKNLAVELDQKRIKRLFS